MRNFLFLSILLCTSLLNSCDNPKSDCKDHYFTDNVKAYTVFPEGSYWVYEDSALSIIDSVYFHYSELGFSNECSYKAEPSEFIKQTIVSSTFNKEGYNITIFADQMFAYGNKSYAGFYIDNQSSNSYEDYILEEIDSIEVNGVMYKDVINWHNESSAFYWVKNIGMIRKVFQLPSKDSVTYNFDLVDYSVKQ